MITRLSVDARKVVLTSAADEARRRGDRRLGTDHLLLGLLHSADSKVARALGTDLESARAASDALDVAALAAVGIDVVQLGDAPRPVFARRLLPLTSGSRTVMKAVVDQTRQAGLKRIESRQFLLALLDRERPDPAAELLRALGVDPAEVRERLGGAAE
ncbi:MAG: Clp protease N-terminal domain-containing protein [Dermatophilaceae bacterium]